MLGWRLRDLTRNQNRVLRRSYEKVVETSPVGFQHLKLRLCNEASVAAYEGKEGKEKASRQRAEEKLAGEAPPQNLLEVGFSAL